VEEQALDLKSWLRVARRRWLLIGSSMVLGLAGGVAYAWANPVLFTSQALVLVAPSPTNRPALAITTQAEIATSQAILDSAGAQVTPPLGYAVLQRRIVATGITANILQITASGTTARQAKELANAVATGFVTYATSGAASPLGPTAGTGTAILDRATTVVAPSPWHTPMLGLVGALAGLLVGTLIALLAGPGDERLRRLEDIETAIGAPVDASLSLRARAEPSDWFDLLLRWTPGIESAWLIRQILDHMADGQSDTDVVVASLRGDRTALALAPTLAASAAAFGIPTTFIVETDDESASSLREATATLAADSAPRRPNLRLFETDRKRTPSSAKTIKVTAVVLDPREPRRPAANRANTTWLALSRGFATAEELARVSRGTAARRQPIGGVVVVNPVLDDPIAAGRPARTATHLPRANGAGRPVPGRMRDITTDATR
jgi:capsular polysaccharide biosynthesis protein